MSDQKEPQIINESALPAPVAAFMRYLIVIAGAIPILIQIFGEKGVIGIVEYFKGDQGIGPMVLSAGLHRLGYGLKASGDYDADVETAVRAFQRHWRPARVDGVADGETRARLTALLRLVREQEAA